MVKLNQIEAEILQGGNAVREYEDPTTETTRDSITRYIEIKEGQPFVILFARDPDYDLTYYDTFILSLRIDGRYSGRCIFPIECLFEKDGRIIQLMDGYNKVIKGRQVLQEFRFEETELRQTKSKETLDQLRKRFRDQGTICVDIYQCLRDLVTDDEDSSDEEEEEEEARCLVPKDIIKEKGSTSTASLRNIEHPHPGEQSTGSRSKFVTSEESIVAKFQFKYRTIEALYDQQIVPRPEKDRETLRIELETLQRNYDELKQKLKKEEADKVAGISEKKRKTLQTLEPGEIELVEERPAHRRKPNPDDVVIELDD